MSLSERCRCSDDGCVEPNLARIPADGDAIALGRFGARHTTVALRRGSAALLRDALLATAISQVIRSDDPRDVMVGLAVDYFVAQQLGLVPAGLLGDVASCLPDGWVPDLLREFGARTDITLKAFGWLLVETAGGPDFTPAPPPWAHSTTTDNPR